MTTIDGYEVSEATARLLEAHSDERYRTVTPATAPERSGEHRDGRFCNVACARCDGQFAEQAAQNTARRAARRWRNVA